MNRRWYPVIALVVSLAIFIVFRRGSGARIVKIWPLLPKHETRVFDQRELSSITGTVIHHTTGPAAQTPRSVAEYHSGPNHVCENGCPGNLYHFMIDRSGMIWQTQPLQSISWHTKNHNQYKASICLIGDYNVLEMTPIIAKSIRYTLRYIERVTGNEQIVSAHRDHRPTSCPGQNVQLDSILS